MDRRLLAIAAAGLLVGGAVALFALKPPVLAEIDWTEDPYLKVVTDLDRAPTALPAAGAKNVVLVLGCTVRRDQVTPYGGEPEVTPFLGELSAAGVQITDLIAAAPWTRAASSAVLTGRHAIELGMVEPGPDRNDRRLPEEAVTLAERFRGAGYLTIGGTTNPNLNDVFGFDQGFDAYLQLKKLWRENMVKLPGDRMVPQLMHEVDTRRVPGRPLFLQVMLVDAHAPYPPPDPDHSRYAEEGVPAEMFGYRAALRRLDDSLRSLQEALVERGFTEDNTFFVFVSDHGEGLSYPEHHGRSHGRYLYPTAVHGVWLASGPGIAPGSRVQGVVSQIDIAPTLLGLAGLPPGEGGGLDLSEPLRVGGRSPRELAYSDTWFMSSNRLASYGNEISCMKNFAEDDPPAPTGRFVEGCYDRTTDPLYLDPLQETDPERMAGLIQWRLDRSTGTISGDVVEVGVGLGDQLEALGYVQREGTP